MSATGQQTTVQTSSEKREHYDLLARHKITAGNKVIYSPHSKIMDFFLYWHVYETVACLTSWIAINTFVFHLLFRERKEKMFEIETETFLFFFLLKSHQLTDLFRSTDK